MHMSDALLSPIVGGAMVAVSATTIGYSVKKITGDKLDEKKIPMMAVMGAFVFAGQMINFTIPGTGSSGHIGGGILLAALLGPFEALLTLASVLIIQCLFFADGGLLAIGCNIFNMGICTCIISYFLFYKLIIKRGINKKSLILASIISVVLGLQFGAFSVVLETVFSGVTELPFRAFLILMQPIHLAIGLVEGIVTSTILCFVYNVRPELLISALEGTKIEKKVSTKKFITTFLILAIIIGGGLSLFASAFPDGLEWAINNITNSAKLQRNDGVHKTVDDVVKKTTLMPDYNFSGDNNNEMLGKSISGIVGSVITIFLAGGIGLTIHYVKKKNNNLVK